MRIGVGKLVIGLLVVLTGCGGGPRTHSEFVQNAGRICHEANHRFGQVEIERLGATRAVRALADVVEIGLIAIHDLRRLKPPKGDGNEVDAWLGALEQALDEVDYARTLLRDDEIARAVAAIARADVLTRRARMLARAIGVARVCAVPELLDRG